MGRGSVPQPPVPALVLGTGITALAVLRRMGRLGVPAYVVTDSPGFVRGSRWFARVPGSPASPEPGGLAEWLHQLEVERAVLFPCSDETVVEVASLPHDLARRFPASVPPVATARSLVDKLGLARVLAAAGVSHPRTVQLRDKQDLDAVHDEELIHSFLKPTQSQAFFRAFKRKGFTVEERGTARARVAEVLERGFGLVLQELVPGPASNQFCIDGFVDREGNIRALFARQWLLKFPPDFGESCLSRSVPLDDVPEAVDLAERSIRALPYRGVFSVELKKSASDGRFRVLEVNIRPWWYVGFTCRAGVNVCRMSYLDALCEPISDEREYRSPMYSVYPTLQIHARRALTPSERRELPPLPGTLRTWLTGVQPIFEWTDPGPSLIDISHRIARRLSRPFR